jgi:NAD(P)-dependent dehydrogenase (short-subunit alcohol dehydrogenase family)
MSSAGDPPVLLVTGFSGRLGLALAELLPDALVAGIYNRNLPAVASQAARPLGPDGSPDAGEPSTFVIRADLSTRRGRERAVELALARFGRIDHLVNAAGDLRLLGSTVEAWAWESEALRQFRLNTIAPLALASIVARDFWRDRPEENRLRKRSVVNVSSVSGLRVIAGEDQAAYSASKAALNFLSLHMCEEYDSIGIRVNVVAPTAFPRQVATRDVAASIVDLLSSDATGKIG